MSKKYTMQEVRDGVETEGMYFFTDYAHWSDMPVDIQEEVQRFQEAWADLVGYFEDDED